MGGGGGTAAAGASWGNAVSGVGSRATDRDNMIDCLVAIDVITSKDAIANDDGGHDSDCEVPVFTTGNEEETTAKRIVAS